MAQVDSMKEAIGNLRRMQDSDGGGNVCSYAGARNNDSGNGVQYYASYGPCYSFFACQKGWEELWVGSFQRKVILDSSAAKKVNLVHLEPLCSKDDALDMYADWLMNRSPYIPAFEEGQTMSYPSILRMNSKADTWLVHQAATQVRMPKEHFTVVHFFGVLVKLGYPEDLAYYMACTIGLYKSGVRHNGAVSHAAISNTLWCSLLGFVHNKHKKKGTAHNQCGTYIGHGDMWSNSCCGPTISKVLNQSLDPSMEVIDGGISGPARVIPYNKLASAYKLALPIILEEAKLL